MVSIKRQIRSNQALDVIMYTSDGMSITKACLAVGIARSTFYYFCTTNLETILSFQEMQLLSSLQQFHLLLENQDKVLERLIQDGLSDTTKPRQRLAIYRELTKRLDELMEQVHVSYSDTKGEADFLTGPKLVHAQPTSS